MCDTDLQGRSVDKSGGERGKEKGASDDQTGGSVTPVSLTDTVVDHHLEQQQYFSNNQSQHSTISSLTSMHKISNNF